MSELEKKGSRAFLNEILFPLPHFVHGSAGGPCQARAANRGQKGHGQRAEPITEGRVEGRSNQQSKFKQVPSPVVCKCNLGFMKSGCM